MGAEHISLTLAFTTGFLSFFSPCILPLIPVYIMYITGSTAESELSENKWRVISRTFGFILGFSFIFVLMGLSATALGRLFIHNKLFFLKLSGWVMILFGLNMFGLFKFIKVKMPTFIKMPSQVNSFFGAVIMGMAFGAGWTPCFGPVLGSIVFYAGASSTATQGIILLLIYALGMAIPFMLTAVFINVFNRLLEKANAILKYIPKVSGIILIIFGILILTNKLTALNALFF